MATPKPGSSQPFLLEAKPNSAIALLDVYKTQESNTVEVLKGWKVKYTAPQGVNDPEWFQGANSIGTGSSIEHPEDTVGSFSVTYKAGGVTSAARTLVVGAVQSDSFSLTPGGSYKKSTDPKLPHFVQRPVDQDPVLLPALLMAGRVSKTAPSPELTKFYWGFIQSIELTQNVRLYADEFSPTPGTKGVSVIHTEYFSYSNIPPGTNDATARGTQLYHNVSANLGSSITGNNLNDTPGWRKGDGTITRMDNTGQPVTIKFRMNQPNTASYSFKVWQVVYHDTTKQYVPLKQQSWKLEWDTNQNGPWSTQVIGSAADATTIPPDATNYSGYYLGLIYEGPNVTRKIP